ncbi:transposase [Candidatus Peregrinibacteria bacterium]|nr:MAG: transposase [Candidatus Peregrinibacteria bacterium]QQR54638.1 MAG: transposase [Candidatus Peregrinibacteria bacterium]
MYQMLTDEQFKLIQPYFPKPRKPEKIPLKRCMDAICYVLKTGCAWRQMPYDYREKRMTGTRFIQDTNGGANLDFWTNA